MIKRRQFLQYLSAFGTNLFFQISSAWAKSSDKDFFEGSDYIGKTRGGDFQKFYVNFWKTMRRIDGNSWQLEIGGLVKNPTRFSLAEVRSLPLKSQISRLKCVECWSAKAEWAGFHISDIESIVQPDKSSTGVLFHCGDNYQEYLERTSLSHPRTLLAYAMDGNSLSDGHGFPLRVIAPFKYGYKNPKAILKMEYVDGTVSGTWSKIGPYSTDGTILPGYDHPLDRGKVKRRIAGGEIFD